MEQRLNPGLKNLALKIFPDFLLKFLDPFIYTIKSEIRNLSEKFDKKGVNILDAGCGENKLKDNFKRANFTGIDNLIGDKDWDYSKVDIIGNIKKLPFKENSFDLIISIVTLEHIDDPLKPLKEFKRVLKKDGKVFIVVPFMWEYHQIPHDYFRFTESGIKKLLEKSDINDVEIKPVGGFFWLFSRRMFNFLTFFQKNFLWIFFIIFTPIFFFLAPIFYILDRLDKKKYFTLGYLIKSKW